MIRRLIWALAAMAAIGVFVLMIVTPTPEKSDGGLWSRFWPG